MVSPAFDLDPHRPQDAVSEQRMDAFFVGLVFCCRDASRHLLTHNLRRLSNVEHILIIIATIWDQAGPSPRSRFVVRLFSVLFGVAVFPALSDDV